MRVERVDGPADVSVARQRRVVICRNFSRNGSTPKFVSAEPKNTGESLPWWTALEIKLVAGAVEQLHVIAQRVVQVLAEQTLERRIVDQTSAAP